MTRTGFTLPQAPSTRKWGRLHSVEPKAFLGGLADNDEAPRGAPMPHPLAVQSWAVREIRTGRVTVVWSNADGRQELEA